MTNWFRSNAQAFLPPSSPGGATRRCSSLLALATLAVATAAAAAGADTALPLPPGPLGSVLAQILAANNRTLAAWARNPDAASLDWKSIPSNATGEVQAFLSDVSDYKNILAHSFGGILTEAPEGDWKAPLQAARDNVPWEEGDQLYRRALQAVSTQPAGDSSLFRTTHFHGYLAALAARASATLHLLTLLVASRDPKDPSLARDARAVRDDLVETAERIRKETPPTLRDAQVESTREALLSDLNSRLAGAPGLSALRVWGTAGVLEVAAGREGGYSEIEDAVARARPGALVRVHPGVYHKPVILDSTIAIQGDGDRDEIVLECAQAPCVLSTADGALLSGITLRQTNPAGTEDTAALEVTRGTVAVQSCEIVAVGSSCVNIHGRDAAPALADCRIHGSLRQGVLCTDHAAGTLDSCEISDSAVNVMLKTQAAPVLRNCHLLRGGTAGMAAVDDARGILETCEFSENGIGVVVSLRSAPALRSNCTIRASRSVGVYFDEGAAGTLDDCEIAGSALSGIEIAREATPVVRNCRLFKQGQAGILVDDGGQGVFDKCDVHNNGLAGVEVLQGGKTAFQNCRIHEGNTVGVYVHEGGGGTFRDCDLRGNSTGARAEAAGSQARFTKLQE